MTQHSNRIVVVVMPLVIPSILVVVVVFVVVVLVPDVAVFSSEHPAVVDQYSAAVVVSTGLQADLPGPVEGAGLCHIPHRCLTILGH